MKIEAKTFTSKISKRIFTTFLGFALLPVVCLAGIAYFQISYHLKNHTTISLRDAVKSIALNIDNHIKVLENELEYIRELMNYTNPGKFSPLNNRLRSTLEKGFNSITVFENPDQPQPIFNELAIKSIQLTPDEIKHISENHTLLTEVNAPQSKPLVLMLRQFNAKNKSKGFLAGEINVIKLWAIDELTNFPIDTELCILDSSQNLLYSSKLQIAKIADTLKTNTQQSTSGQFEFNFNEEQYFAAYTKIFLKPSYYLPQWTAILIKAKSDINAPVAGFKIFFPAIIILTLLVVLWLSIVNIRKNLVPIEILKAGAKRIAKRDFSQKIDIQSGDEFEELGSAFNLANQQLDIYHKKSEQAQNVLRNARDNLEKTVKMRTAELIKAKKHAVEANKAKSEFLANMSHELRTPLNHIIGFTQLIIDKQVGDLNETQEDYLNDVHNSSQHLLSLINDILDLSKVEAGKLELQSSLINLPELLDSCLILVKEKTMRHSIELQLEVNGLDKTISADERKLKQIMYNLLSNAVKFTPDGGKILVKARRYDLEGTAKSPAISNLNHSIFISISDTGVGLKSEDLDLIFNPFQQADNTKNRNYQGTGLGLSLTKKLVELHGGIIWAESEGEGCGATFNFALPIVDRV